MKSIFGVRRLLLAAASSMACLYDRSNFPGFSPIFISGDAADSQLDRAAGTQQPSFAAANYLPSATPGATPRRLSFSAAMVNFATQLATSQEIRQLMRQWTGMMGEVFKGPDTTESFLPYYWKVPECVLTVDFGSATQVAHSDSAKVALAYTPVHNDIMLAYVEEQAEWVQLMKRPLRRVQFLHLPAECMVDENTTYSAFCMEPKGRCKMVRLDINLTRITKQMLNTLKPIPAADFIQQKIEEGFMYDDALDILEAPTTVGRLLFDGLNCIMHTRVQAIGPDRIFIYHNPLDQSLRVDAQNTDGSFFRKKVIIPPGCGGTEEKDFTASVYLQPDGYYKVVIQTIIARGTDHDRTSQNNIEIRNGKDIRPTSELTYGEHDPADMYPGTNYIPLETMAAVSPF